jgi:hypothetical protein
MSDKPRPSGDRAPARADVAPQLRAQDPTGLAIGAAGALDVVAADSAEPSEAVVSGSG